MRNGTATATTAFRHSLVIDANAGIQCSDADYNSKALDPRFRGDDVWAKPRALRFGQNVT